MIYLMRHGIDDENYVGGFSDVSLTKEGKDEVYRNGLWIKDNLNIEKIITSDVKRALETSDIISQILNLEIIKTSILREQNKGILNGRLKSSLNDYEKRLLYEQKIDTVFLNGESLIDLYNRIKENLDYLMTLDNSLIVTHRGVINMIYYILNDIDLDMNKNRFNVTHASIHELDLNNRKIKRIK